MNGKNLYVYCCNNPVNAVDEEGSLAQVVGVIEKLLETPYGRFLIFGLLGGVTYLLQCELGGEDATKEGLCVAAISGGINGAVGDIRTAIFVSVAGGIYLEYRETKDVKRAVVAGAYDGISTILAPDTYSVYVKKMSEEVALSLFSDLFQAPILGHGKSGVLDGIFGKPKKQENKNGSTLKKNNNSSFSTKKRGGTKKNWQNNKPAISKKMQEIGLPALR